MNMLLPIIKTTTPSSLRNNMAKLFEDISDNGVEVHIANSKGKNLVIITEDQLNSYRETDYLLMNKANRDHLLRGIKSVEEHRDLK